MSNAIKATAPASIGLSLNVLSGPRGTVRDKDWPCIEYTCELLDSRRRVIWTGPYRLGVGHVKWPKGNEAYPEGITQDERHALNTVRMRPGAVLVDKQLWANTAAKLAKAQKVTPSLDSVTASLMMNGSAFFDGETFEDWAANFDYDADSIKAKGIYEECDKTGRTIARALSRDELAGLREWASQY